MHAIFFSIIATFLFLLPTMLMASDAAIWEFHEDKSIIADEKSRLTLSMFHGQQVLLLFWRADCAPCLHELNELPDVVRDHPSLQIVTIALQNGISYNDFFSSSLSGNVHPWIAQGNRKALLASFNNGKSILPFSVFLSADGRACERHEGILGADKISQWVQSC